MADGSNFAVVAFTIVAGVIVTFYIFVTKFINRVAIHETADVDEQEKLSELPSASKKQSNKPNAKKRNVDKRVRDVKQNFTHPWLLTSLKGHSSTILDMDLSPNGKYLATCGEVEPRAPDPGGGVVDGVDGTQKALLTRRQKKNRSPKKTLKKPPPWRDIRLLSSIDLETFLRRYQITSQQLVDLGFPIQSQTHPGRAIIINRFPPFEIVREPRYSESGSGGSGSEEAEDDASLSDPNARSEERRCARCGRGFFQLEGKYLTTERCVYHWGKPTRDFGYTCCKSNDAAAGCSIAKLHVWTGLEFGLNGPFDGFVITQPSKTPPVDGTYGIYSIDCEMCYTTHGLEVCKVSVVSIDRRTIYDTLVKPINPIVDYNTRFSGLSGRHYRKNSAVKSLKEVQNDLLEFISAETILLGHGLENDLKALKIIHPTVVDTAVAFPHHFGLPFRRSLRSLVNSILHRDIQDRTVLLWRVKDWSEKDHKSVRVNVEYDHSNLIRWSPDSKAFLIHKVTANELQAYRIAKKPDGVLSGATKGLTYPKVHSADIVGLGIASTGKFIVSCSSQTDLVISDVKGTLLSNVDNNLIETYCAGVSPCGRYVYAAGFAPDAMIWEVRFSKSGEFNQVVRAFQFQGHRSGIHCVAFNQDSSRAVTASKDGTWRLYNIQVEWKNGEDPHLIQTGHLPEGSHPTALALSPTGDIVAVACGPDLHLYFADTAELDETFHDVYSADITRILFDSQGKYILAAGEKHVRIFHNVTGLKATATLAKAKLLQPGLTVAMKERLTLQMEQSEAFIASLSS